MARKPVLTALLFWLLLCTAFGLGLAVSAHAEPGSEAPGTRQTAPQQEYSSDYLQAEEEVANRAGLLFVVGIVELAITFVGVILVGLTLRAASASAREAKRAADVAEKNFARLDAPYVYPTALRYFTVDSVCETTAHLKVFSNAEVGPCFAAKAKNYGRLPAKMLAAKFRFSVIDVKSPDGPPVATVEHDCLLNFMLGERDASEEFSTGPVSDVIPYMDEIDRGTKLLTVWLSLKFEDHFGQQGSNGSAYTWDPEANEFASGLPSQLLKRKQTTQ